MNGYDGHLNYVTWRVALEVGQEPALLEMIYEWAGRCIKTGPRCHQVVTGSWPAERAPVYLLADDLLEYFQDRASEFARESGGYLLFTDFITYCIGEVDWNYLAELYLADWRLNQSEEDEDEN